ncbi:ABC transporter ATP-binding protein [Microbacterium sp. Leaf159]|uniref:ABC transporter ATP-binding protein n=1 Tax=Microbacterium sp. Leaf159 TaxID=1736279 RepID=UPI0009EA2D94|nr:ABC transporter ATP-binding protein [Microbacterium sp. Leaf159]
MLEATALRAGYGKGPDVLLDADLNVGTGEIVAMIGLNGAGKSTIARTLAGLLPVRAGTVTFDGEDITTLTTDERARRGLLLVPEGRELCGSMTVEENLTLGTVPLPRAERRRRGAENLDLVYTLFPILQEKARQDAGSLSGGQQQMVAVGRALMGSPRLLILDEPSLGLAPLLVREIFQVVAQLNADGLSVLVAEQNAALAISHSNRAYHIELGEIAETDGASERRSLLRGGALGGDEIEVAALDLPEYRAMGRRAARGG